MIGAAVTRREDARVLLGQTRYLDDLELAGLAHVAFVRSPHARASITAIEAPAAADGLLAVVTAADRDGLVRPFPVPPLDGAELADEPHPVLARDEVRYAGQPVAAVIETRGASAEHDPGRDLLAVWCSAQDPHRPRAQLAHILSRPDDGVRVIVPDVGGAFGG